MHRSIPSSSLRRACGGRSQAMKSTAIRARCPQRGQIAVSRCHGRKSETRVRPLAMLFCFCSIHLLTVPARPRPAGPTWQVLGMSGGRPYHRGNGHGTELILEYELAGYLHQLRPRGQGVGSAARGSSRSNWPICLLGPAHPDRTELAQLHRQSLEVGALRCRNLVCKLSGIGMGAIRGRVG